MVLTEFERSISRAEGFSSIIGYFDQQRSRAAWDRRSIGNLGDKAGRRINFQIGWTDGYVGSYLNDHSFARKCEVTSSDAKLLKNEYWLNKEGDKEEVQGVVKGKEWGENGCTFSPTCTPSLGMTEVMPGTEKGLECQLLTELPSFLLFRELLWEGAMWMDPACQFCICLVSSHLLPLGDLWVHNVVWVTESWPWCNLPPSECWQ